MISSSCRAGLPLKQTVELVRHYIPDHQRLQDPLSSYKIQGLQQPRKSRQLPCLHEHFSVRKPREHTQVLSCQAPASANQNLKMQLGDPEWGVWVVVDQDFAEAVEVGIFEAVDLSRECGT
jgi:hypothetical protein